MIMRGLTRHVEDLIRSRRPRRFKASEEDAATVRTAITLRAVSGICTHQGCRLAFAARSARLVCPCHGATFALDGTVLTHKLPVPLEALPRIEVREVSGAVQVFAPHPDL
jgi:cytochrome b6-f complex iron-sulfur subunit